MAVVVPFPADTSGPFSQLLATEHTAQTVQAWIQERKDAISTMKRQAIDQDTPFEVIYEPIKQLEGDIGRFKRLLQSNEALRADCRQVHMAAWRATVRPLRVIDLPHEILAMVFANFQEDAIGETKALDRLPHEPLSSTASSVEVIKKIRLTCRAFCNAGSRFLLPTVEIRLTRSSLQRLQGISNHSTISRGVQVVHIDTKAYYRAVAMDRTRFYQLIQSDLINLNMIAEEDVARSRRTFAEESYLTGFISQFKSRETQVHETVLKGIQDLMVAVYKHVGQESGVTPPRDPFEARISSAMEQAHEEYEREFREQEHLIQDAGTFADISTAVGLMPSVRRISIGSLRGCKKGYKAVCVAYPPRIHTQKCEAMLSSPNPFRAITVCPGTMGTTWLDWSTDPSSSMLFKLPLLLQAGSGSLTQLRIDLPPLEHGVISMDLEGVRHACQQLTHVEIRVVNAVPSPGWWYSEDLERIYPLLEAMLVSTRLELVKLDLPAREFASNLSVARGQPLAKLSCDKLRTLFLSFFTFKAEELRQLLDKVHGKVRLDLRSCNLLEGTWAESLEIMRGKADSLSRVLNVSGTEMDQLHPREIEYLRDQFDCEHRDGWYSAQRCPGPASFYIRGGNIPNPLLRFDD